MGGASGLSSSSRRAVRPARRAHAAALVAGLAALASVATACPSDVTPTPPTTPQNSYVNTWALGDSQGAENTDPARGLPWTERLGDNVGNGALNMAGAGWLRPGTTTFRTIPQRAQDLADVNQVQRFVVMAGVNDLKDSSLTTAQILTGVDQLEALAAARGIQVTYVGVVPFPSTATIANRNAARLAFNNALAQRYPSRYINCDADLATNGWLKPVYSLSPLDLHLNDAGEAVLAECISDEL